MEDSSLSHPWVSWTKNDRENIWEKYLHWNVGHLDNCQLSYEIKANVIVLFWAKKDKKSGTQKSLENTEILREFSKIIPIILSFVYPYQTCKSTICKKKRAEKE